MIIDNLLNAVVLINDHCNILTSNVWQFPSKLRRRQIIEYLLPWQWKRYKTETEMESCESEFFYSFYSRGNLYRKKAINSETYLNPLPCKCICLCFAKAINYNMKMVISSYLSNLAYNPKS